MAGKGGGSCRKKPKLECKAYKLSNRAEKNKIKRLQKRVAEHPNDRAAANRLTELRKQIGVFK